MRRCSELSPIGKAASWILIAFCIAGAVLNITRGEVRHPWAFGIVLLGFVLFLVSKLFGHSPSAVDQLWNRADDGTDG